MDTANKKKIVFFLFFLFPKLNNPMKTSYLTIVMTILDDIRVNFWSQNLVLSSLVTSAVKCNLLELMATY